MTSEQEAQEAFLRFVSSPVKKFLVTPDEYTELHRRAQVLVSACFKQDVTQQEFSEQVAHAFVRLINNHAKHGEAIVPDEHWLD